jgi:hypothetical protein
VRLFVLVSCLLGAASCADKGQTGPTVPLNERFVLAPGGVVAIADADIRLQLVGVTGDSRCPADAFCIQGGDATVQIRVFDTGTSMGYELHTSDARRASVAHRGLRIDLLELQPYPFSSRTIDPSDYRATVVVSR